MDTPLQLHRDPSFQTAFREWKTGPGSYQVRNQVRELYEEAFFGANPEGCSLVQTGTYSMLLLHPVYGWDTDTYRFLMDQWKELILEQGYYPYMSDLRNELLDGGIRRQIERHYLKPDVYEAMKNGENVNRLYGNLTLELVLSNREMDHLKLTLGYYHDHPGRRELSLEKLMEVLLK